MIQHTPEPRLEPDHYFNEYVAGADFLQPFCPDCGMPCEVDEETGLIVFCLGCEGGLGKYPDMKEDEDYEYC